MGYKKKTWQEKMADKKGLPKVIKLNGKEPCFKALQKMGTKVGDRCVITNPREVEEIMKKVPKGKLITIREICMKLAKKHKVDACCTLTTGIFVTIAANAAEEMRREGKKSDNPYWRTLKADGFLNEKYPGGIEAHKKLLEKEGFRILQKGKKYFVENYENYLVK
jgi:alkylated DNA nucleotide flippase Atl1